MDAFVQACSPLHCTQTLPRESHSPTQMGSTNAPTGALGQSGTEICLATRGRLGRDALARRPGEAGR